MANTLGTLSGTLVTMRLFELIRVYFPLIQDIGTDMSADSVNYNQQVVAHIPTVPPVTTYNTTTGWPISDAATTDVPVTIDQAKGVHCGFNSIELSSTSRDLLAEQIRGQAYALAKDLFDAIMALITSGNFTNSIPVTIANTDRTTITAAKKQQNIQGSSIFGRYVIGNSDFAEKLANDPALQDRQLFPGAADLEGAYVVINGLYGYRNIWEYPELPTAGNLNAFAGNTEALVFASRLPADVGVLNLKGIPLNGRFTPVTNTDSGISMLSREWHDPNKGHINMGHVWMYGVAPGPEHNGLRIVET